MEKIRQIEKMVKKKEDIEDGEVKSGSDDDPALKMLNQLKSQIVSECLYVLSIRDRGLGCIMQLVVEDRLSGLKVGGWV